MAQSVHLFLKAAGNDVHGESTITSLDRENSIECLSFTDAVRTAREASSGMATGDRTYEPLVVQLHEIQLRGWWHCCWLRWGYG